MKVLEAGLLPVVGQLMSSQEPAIAATAELVFSSTAWVKAEEEFEQTINLQRKQWQQIQQAGHDQQPSEAKACYKAVHNSVLDQGMSKC